MTAAALRSRRWLLWGALLGLVVALLGVLVFLATEYEQQRDQAALEAHGASAHFKEIGARMGSCLAGRPDVEYLDAV